MRLGTLAIPFHLTTRTHADILDETVGKVILADQLGFAETWVSEHISCLTEPIASPLVILSSLIRQTRKIKFATGVIALTNQPPATVASEVAEFDHVSKGRLIFGIGPGGRTSQTEPFDVIDGDVRNAKTAESISTILQFWSQDPPYDIAGKYWPIKLADLLIPEPGAGYLAKPSRKLRPQVALSLGSPDSTSVSYAALKGWVPVTANFAPATGRSMSKAARRLDARQQARTGP